MSARDALTWLTVLVNEGVVDGKQIIDPKAIQATRALLTAANTSFGSYQRDYYGLGWYVGPYGEEGVDLVHHFGGFSGARAHVSYMPKKRFGVAIFVNDSQVGSDVIDAIANHVYDSLLGYVEGPESLYKTVTGIADWKNDMVSRIEALRVQIKKREWSLERPLEQYQGTYVNDEYGSIHITVEKSTLRVTNGNLTSLAQAGEDSETIRVELIPMSGEQITFKSGWFGGVKELQYDGVTFDREVD